MKIAIVGGTGALGRGLALRWVKAGHSIVIGSRDEARARACASEIVTRVAGSQVEGLDNVRAAIAGELVVLAVPFSEQRAMVEAIRGGLSGKILIDVTVPLRPPKVGTAQLPPEGSAAQITQQLVGDSVKVVAAFHNVGAKHLERDGAIECDVLVCGNDSAARTTVLALVKDAGMRGVHAGQLANAAAMEALTSVLIWINKNYKVDGAGIRITGLEGASNG